MATQSRTWVEPTAKDVEVRGFNMHYYEWSGDGPTVIFLHPSSSFGRVWDWVVQNLIGDFHIFALDQRCHGDSGRPPGPHSGEAYAEDLHAFITALGLKDFHLVGHSLGGRAAQIYAGTHPEYVRTITCSGGPHYSSFFYGSEEEANNPEEVRSTAERPTVYPDRSTLAASIAEGRPSYTQEMVDHIIKYNVIDNSDGTVSPKYSAKDVAEGLSHIPDKLNKYAEKVCCPVLFLRGKQSIPLSRPQSENVAAFYADCTIVDIDGQYFLQFENPVEAAQEYRKFIQNHR